jgi:integrase
MRERRPGVWEIRIAAGTDPVTGRTMQRSVTFRGCESDADAYRRLLAANRQARRSIARAAPMLTVAALLERWLEADHPWRPSTRVGYEWNVRHLRSDERLAATRVADLTPRSVRAALARWEVDGGTLSVVGGRFRVLRSAIGWAYDERIIDVHPLRTMRGPGRVPPRRPLPNDAVAVLLRTAEGRVLEALANDTGTWANTLGRHRAEQDLLLVRVAADSGARRGELAALRFDDLDDRVLHLTRSVSATTITTPKSGRARSLTLGRSTAKLWGTLETEWRYRAEGDLGPWVFSADVAHERRLTPCALGHRFARLADTAGVPGASLHQLRHNVATFLVARGEILQAQARLGHADAATTLREYAYALPLTDVDVADQIDRHLDDVSVSDVHESPVAPDDE